MKPLQIGLLVLVGALGGALIMKFTQRPKPAPVPISSAAPAVAPAPIPPVTATIPEEPPAPKPTAFAEEAPPPAPKKATAIDTPLRTAVKMRHHTQPMLRTPPPVAIAQNVPPVQPEPPAPQPAPPPAPVE